MVSAGRVEVGGAGAARSGAGGAVVVIGALADVSSTFLSPQSMMTRWRLRDAYGAVAASTLRHRVAAGHPQQGRGGVPDCSRLRCMMTTSSCDSLTGRVSTHVLGCVAAAGGHQQRLRMLLDGQRR